MKSLRFHGSWSAHMDPGPEFTYLCWGKKSSKRQKQNPLTATNLQHRCQKFTHQVLPNTISPPLNHKTLWWLEHNHHKCKQMRETDTQKVMLMLLSTALAGVAQWIECQTVNPKVASWFPVRAHAWVAGQDPSGGHVRGNHTLMFLSLSFSLPSPLSKNK